MDKKLFENLINSIKGKRAFKKEQVSKPQKPKWNIETNLESRCGKSHNNILPVIGRGNNFKNQLETQQLELQRNQNVSNWVDEVIRIRRDRQRRMILEPERQPLSEVNRLKYGDTIIIRNNPYISYGFFYSYFEGHTILISKQIDKHKGNKNKNLYKLVSNGKLFLINKDQISFGRGLIVEKKY